MAQGQLQPEPPAPSDNQGTMQPPPPPPPPEVELSLEAQKTLQKRRQLRQSNIDAWANKPDPTKFGNLDSNLKKNTAFITKCRAGLTADTAAMLIQGIKTLKLEKYLSEIIVAIVEGLQKCKTSADIAAAAEVISALHQRFSDTFTPPLNQALVRALAPPVRSQLRALPADQREKEESSRVQKQRVLLRVAGELWLLGIFLSGKEVKVTLKGAKDKDITGAPLPAAEVKERDRKDASAGKEKDRDKIGGIYYCVLKDLLANDKNLHVNIPLAVVFVKHFGNEILGIVPRKQQMKRSRSMEEQAQEKGMEVVDERPMSASNPSIENVTSEEQQGLFKALLMEFFTNVSSTLAHGHKTLRQLEKKNNEWYIKIGEIPDETKTNFERMQKTYEKFLANAQMLSDGLDVSLPELIDADDASKSDSIISNSGSSFSREDTNGSGIWEDEEEKMFYEDVIDLRELVPPVLLERKRKMSAETEENKDDESDKDDQDDDIEGDFEMDENDMEEDDDGEDYEMNEENMEKMMQRMGIDLDEATGDEPDDTLDKDPAQHSAADENSELGSIKPGRSVQLTALLSRLKSMINRDMIDKAAVEYCYMNSKGARRLLIRALLSVPKFRLDLLPYYCRLIATLNRYFPEIGAAIVKALDLEFRCYMKTSSKRGLPLPPQIRNIRYIGELTKFKVIPVHIIFHTLKVLIERFKAGKVEVCCALVENCGRYLLRNPDTNLRMKHILEIMMRKKGVQHLDGRQLLMIENAYYMCNPPDRPVVVRRARSPMELYIRKLVYGDLSKKTAEKTLKQLRKLPWGRACSEIQHNKGDEPEKENRDRDEVPGPEHDLSRANGVDVDATCAETKKAEDEIKVSEKEQEKGGADVLEAKPKTPPVGSSLLVETILLKIFTKIWKVRYSNVHLLAILVQGLVRYHSEFAVSVVDQILEDIRIGLESNIFKHNQRRISQVKFLGELYNYRVIESPVIFDTLYTIVTLGHEHGRPAKYRPSPIDSLNDFFRVRLCCTLLDTCGMCFDRGSSKVKLDAFLAFFQMYIFSKNDMPMDVEFMVEDTFEALRPKMKRFESYEEAAEKVDEILFGTLKVIKENDADHVNEIDASDSSEAEDEGIRHQEAADSGDEEEGRGEEEEQRERDGNDVDEEEDDVVVFERQRALDEADTQADAEFELEFGKLMSESVDSRKFERKATFDVPIPMHLKGHATVEKSRTDTENGPAVAFTLLTKKGNKQQLKMMEIPSNSPLAVNTKSKQEAEREEQQRLKQLVLSYEERENSGGSRQPAIEDPYQRYGSRQGYSADFNDPLVGPMQSSQRRNQRGREQKVLLVGGGGGGAAYQRRH